MRLLLAVVVGTAALALSGCAERTPTPAAEHELPRPARVAIPVDPPVQSWTEAGGSVWTVRSR
ncbi:hypothetical protein V5P93_000876 [Actinokineospora auranticolor]|uniref:Uncharacterized protein n=1 Tax=Actinokineospora auranticolor TaxID=155976 RepID=A0A2S6GYK3_9PSEU|nr:hypothetical protein [Actinokineospora auranticolor]PPK70246.1 hypothetical protein CLV40_102157 [Actinokineospora auranticolor]